MAMGKTLAEISGMTWNLLEAKSAPRKVTNELECKKSALAEWDPSFKWCLFLGNVPLNMVIQCVIENPPISWSGRCVINYKFSVFILLRSKTYSTNIGQKMFQLQSMSNLIECVDQSFAAKNFDESCLTLIVENKIVNINWWKIVIFLSNTKCHHFSAWTAKTQD